MNTIETATLQEMAHNTLEKYREWLNLWQADSGIDHRYALADLKSKEITHYHSGWYYVMVLEVNDEDEGGPAIITAWFSPDWSLTQSRNNPRFTTEPWVIVQEFDTNLQFILNEGKFLNTP
mgnify:CR=1 FL=1